MEIYEVMVLGAGPGGYLCAEKATAAGFSTVLFEEEYIGGTCLNVGCIPTKALLNSAKIYRHARDGISFGVSAPDIRLDHALALKHKDDVIRTLVSGVETGLKKNKVTVVRGHAEIKGKNGSNFEVVCGGQSYLGRRLVIATGSETAVPPIPGLKEGLASGFVVTNKEILSLAALPKRLAVLGGGIIGLEMASYFLDAGCDVTIVEMLPKIAGPTDADLSNRLLAEYKKRGIKFMLSTKVTSVEADGLTCEAGSVSEKIGCDLILLAAGRRAVTKGFGLETLAPAMSRAGIITNEYTETNVPGLFAIGDCNGTSMLAHTAYREAETAVELFKGRKVPVRYDCIPSVIYTDPEIASVGLTKEAALGRGLRVKEVKVPLSYSGRYIAENIKGLGFLKLVVDTDRNCIVGVHMMGSYASEIIAAAAIIVETELPIERLKQFVFPHPTVSEVLHEAFNQI